MKRAVDQEQANTLQYHIVTLVRSSLARLVIVLRLKETAMGMLIALMARMRQTVNISGYHTLTNKQILRLHISM